MILIFLLDGGQKKPVHCFCEGCPEQPDEGFFSEAEENPAAPAAMWLAVLLSLIMFPCFRLFPQNNCLVFCWNSLFFFLFILLLCNGETLARREAVD